jgi:phosphoribosylformimino-5-aminoimidazole carboxamide ribotide isomerase
VKIIPVIDLKDGVVVHARQGERDYYQPMRSSLCWSSNIHDVIQAYLSLYAFDTFYIADLDALTGQDNHDALINEVLTAFPQTVFWVDKGYRVYSEAETYLANYRSVLGSESYCDDVVTELKAFDGRFVLSLDYKGDDGLGAQCLFDDAEFWPEDIVIMTLARVGGVSGPDFEKLKWFCQRYPNKNFIAAGGVRDINDLIELQNCGIQYALVASALHSGRLSAKNIADFEAKKYPA